MEIKTILDRIRLMEYDKEGVLRHTAKADNPNKEFANLPSAPQVTRDLAGNAISTNPGELSATGSAGANRAQQAANNALEKSRSRGADIQADLASTWKTPAAGEAPTGGKSKQLASGLKSKGIEVAKSAKEAAAKVSAKLGASAGGKMLSKLLPGVGLVVGTQDAIARAQKGDWVGAGIAGLAAVMSLGGPLTAGASLGLDAYNLYRDSSKEEEKPEGDAAKSADGSTPVNTQPTKGGPAPDPEIQAVQKKILAKDPNALPKYGADGRMGPETQAAMAKYVMSTESQQTVAEGIRSLQERMDLIEAKALIRESLEQTYFLDKNYFMYDKSGEQIVDLLTISVINEAYDEGQIKIKKLS